MSNKKKDLSGQQAQVLVQLLSGATQREAAAQVGVNENTVSRWIRRDPNFAAAYNDGLRSLVEASLVDLASLRRNAVRALDSILKDEDKYHIGLRLSAIRLALKFAPSLADFASPSRSQQADHQLSAFLSLLMPSTLQAGSTTPHDTTPQAGLAASTVVDET